MTVPTTTGLATIAKYAISKSSSHPSFAFTLVFSKGSVVDFTYTPNHEKSAIVNAANEGCLGGGGVDGAITEAGGPNLEKDRLSLPVELVDDGYELRCPTGDAKTTGPGSYGDLRVPYVIHAVGPNYWEYDSFQDGDRLLRSAYLSSLTRSKEAKLEAVAFSLLSSGVFRGKRSLRDVLKLSVETICDFEAHDELKEVHMCAFSEAEADTLVEIAEELGLPKEEEICADD
eukprot:CAMPEP_0185723102 /NCGR_PEP_ID=MMETSP1171-20130828/49_1 /TAXON_ID=374046 /ORGANISM="Helicotheca tamensis, Strain CCMP826" /LENGTH=229 /DNA_ID=CAMNT_0028390765 /DNA_START=53 /DNA_END=742 /DNA_ORIENTATION=+